ncbi:hypothetical protein ACPV5G_19915 [Photobacterium damselae]|uniref:hypothetical protein n=1 Tax=Photobacterium damselae TaxID=38293 RepID=UPI00406971A4
MAENILVYHIGKLMLFLRCEPYLTQEDAETLNDVIDYLKTAPDINEAIALLNTTYQGISSTPKITRSTKLIAIRQLIGLKKYQRSCNNIPS